MQIQGDGEIADGRRILTQAIWSLIDDMVTSGSANDVLMQNMQNGK